MTIRKYLVIIHEDGHVTTIEYEEPTGYAYSAGEGNAYRSGYNRALCDVQTILGAEKARCETNSHIKKFGQDWITSWAARSIECELIKTCIDKLFCKS